MSKLIFIQERAGEKSEKFIEIKQNAIINASSRFLTKGVFDLANELKCK